MTGPRIRILGAAFATVPSSRPHGASMRSMIDALRGDLDLVTLKTEDLPHIKRIGEARMFRVPVGRATREEQRAIYARAVARQIEAEPYDVVHVLDPWAGRIAAERKSQRGFVLLYEMTTFPEGDSLSWLEAHDTTIAAADRILVPTEAARATLEESAALAGRVEVVRPGVDVGGYDWGGVGPFGVPRLLYLGSSGAPRDVPTLLDAIAKVASHRPIHALLAGEHRPDRRADLRADIEHRGLAGIVDVRGEPAATKIPAIVAAADVCLAPSAGQRAAGCTELPQPLLEYLACYRPVIVANVPGVSELVRDEQEALLYPPGSASALADAILEMLRDATLRERLTDAGYRRVRDELNSGARRRRIRDVYEVIAPRSQVHDPWLEEFEEVTGLIELESGAFDVLEGLAEDASLPPPPRRRDVDTAETDAPEETGGEITNPRAPAPTDTHPGLVVPDTDPGRR
ncbi:MAG: glycosyltransferase family 4 protein [Sandaracinaceae bacterium]|nr:glycosyltransferase family 4 protein [Sandaracinaceae bacterium]